MLYPLYLLTFHPLHTYLVPICFVTAWVVLSLLLASLWILSRDTVLYASRIHQIPYANCRFFTANYQLKCTIHPTKALTEEAIKCPDYKLVDHSFTFNSNSLCPTSEIEKATLETLKIKAVRTEV